MKYITVLDFELGKVYQYKLNVLDKNYDYELFIDYQGHNLSNCEWMIHSNNKIITK